MPPALQNGTQHTDSAGYSLETGLHELILQSEHRTLDPEEADFFYVGAEKGHLL